MQGSDMYQPHNTHSLLKIFLETMVDVQCSGVFSERLIQVKLKSFQRDALSYRSYTISNTHTLREILISIFPNIINLPMENTNSYAF
jgi:hypothetical protein